MRGTKAAAAAAAVAALATLGAARWAVGHVERARAVRTAATTAAYLGVVTPAGRSGDPADYDLEQLLVQARALTTLPGWTSELEVYHRTAPLVDAAGAPLPLGALAALRQSGGPRSWRAWALAPLKAKSGAEVVGAVAIRAGRGGPIEWLLGWTLPAAVLAVAVAAAPPRRRPPWHYLAAGLLVGLAAYADVRGAARVATDRWLVDTGLLLREAATRLPIPRNRVALADLAPLAVDAELVEARVPRATPRRLRVAGATRAVLTARLGTGRLVELRTVPAESRTAPWLAVLASIALLGPAAVAGLRWRERTAARPRERRQAAAAWAFLAPASLHLAVFSFVPVAYLVFRSVRGASVAGALRDPLVWISLRNTALYSLYVPVSMAVALGLALLLHRVPPGPAVRLVQAAFLVPYASSVVAVALLWQRMDERLGWLADPRTALAALMLLGIWVQVGYQMAVFLAGLRAIPRAYLDAARVDGAGAWQRFRWITLPLLKPVMLFVLVSGVIGAFQVFTYVYVLTQGGPLHATDVVVFRTYRIAWQFLETGSAGAVSLLLFLTLFGFTWTQFKLLGRRVEHA